MKRFLTAVAVVAATVTSPAFAADVGVSVSIGQPGFYGQLDLGGFPRPQVIYSQPRVIERVNVSRPPVYLRVPPGHSRNWKRHCRHYNACGERVYFVRDNWYNREYVPRHQERERSHREGRRDEHRGDHRDHDRGDRHDNDRDHRRNN